MRVIKDYQNRRNISIVQEKFITYAQRSQVVNQTSPEYIYYPATIQFNPKPMTKKPRCSTCSTGWCKNHVFQLNPLSTSLYYKRNFKIRLCPRINKQSNEFQKIVPLLNKDKKYYTPSFYLQEEKKYYSENDERVMKNHKLKVEQDENSNQTIWIPRHARKRNYCFVCKDDYNDYLQHMDDDFHKKCLRNNSYTPLILELQEKFAQQHKSFPQQKKLQELKREASTEDSSSLSISDHSPKSFEFIRKIRKTNEELHFSEIPQIIKQK